MIPPNLAAMISRLEKERPGHRTIAAMTPHQAPVSHGWSNVTQVFNGIAGVTYYMDYRKPPTLFRAELAAHVEEKIGGGQAPNWIAIGNSGRGQLDVVVRSIEPHSITEVFDRASAEIVSRSEAVRLRKTMFAVARDTDGTRLREPSVSVRLCDGTVSERPLRQVTADQVIRATARVSSLEAGFLIILGHPLILGP